MPTDLIKTLTYLIIHLTIGFSVAYWFTGSIAIATGIAMIEPCINAVAYFFHEKAWKQGGDGPIGRLAARMRGGIGGSPTVGDNASRRMGSVESPRCG